MTTETKFTPGPWAASKLIGVEDLGIVNSYGSAVARIGKLDIANPANAHLIAAAPELYEALAEFVASADAGHVSVETDRKARVALSKARGEA